MVFESCIQFHENGLAGVKKDSKVGYIDTNGDFVIPLSENYSLHSDTLLNTPDYIYTDAYKYKGKLMEATLLTDEQESVIYFDKNGNLVYPKP